MDINNTDINDILKFTYNIQDSIQSPNKREDKMVD